jgi:hypothetical protein
MSGAEDLLNDLSRIGATIEPAGNRLVLRAGPTAIPATLVGQIRKAKHELLAMLVAREERGVGQTDNVRRCDRETANSPQIEEQALRHRTFEDFVIQWLNQHPSPSTPGHCAWCGSLESPSARVVPFGTEPWTHTWLHPECWPDWHRARRIEATTALAAMGITPSVTGPAITPLWQESRDR